MAGLVLMALIAAAIIYISVAKRKKRAFVISVVIIGVYHLYVVHTCGPNAEDVKVMKPMAEKISAYIVKHGIPDKLEDIPDLPYRLEGCERKVKKLRGKDDTGYYGVYLIETNEKCTLDRNVIIDYTYGYYPRKNSSFITIGFENESTETVAYMDMEKKSDSNFKITSSLKFASGKTDGICNPMRQ